MLNSKAYIPTQAALHLFHDAIAPTNTWQELIDPTASVTQPESKSPKHQTDTLARGTQ